MHSMFQDLRFASSRLLKNTSIIAMVIAFTPCTAHSGTNQLDPVQLFKDGKLNEARQQQPERAKAAYERALKLDGASKEAASALRRLNEVR